MGEVRQHVRPLVVEDECGLDVSHSGLAECEDELLQVVCVPGDDMDEEVVLSGDVVDSEDFRVGAGLLLELAHQRGGVSLKLDEDHGLQADPQRARIDLGVYAAHVAGRAELSDPLSTAGWRKTDLRGELFV